MFTAPRAGVCSHQDLLAATAWVISMVCSRSGVPLVEGFSHSCHCPGLEDQTHSYTNYTGQSSQQEITGTPTPNMTFSDPQHTHSSPLTVVISRPVSIVTRGVVVVVVSTVTTVAIALVPVALAPVVSVALIPALVVT